MIFSALLLTACRVVDGDTLRCGSEYIRLQGIDAPEMPGHCRGARVCVDGDPLASQRSLVRALQSGPVRIERTGHDRYGRTIGVVRAGGVNLSCWQILQGAAIYRAKWDSGKRVGRACPTQSSGVVGERQLYTALR